MKILDRKSPKKSVSIFLSKTAFTSFVQIADIDHQNQSVQKDSNNQCVSCFRKDDPAQVKEKICASPAQETGDEHI